MKRSQQQNELKARDEKIKLMNDRQKQWMEERKSNKSAEVGRTTKHNNFQANQEDMSQRSSKNKKQNSTLDKKNSKEVLLWTAKNPDVVNEGFVVRKPPGKSDGSLSSRSSKIASSSRPSSSRLKADKESKSYRTSEGSPDLLTSTPERAFNNVTGPMQISKELSSIRLSEAKADGRLPGGNDSINAYDKLKYSTFNEDVRQSHVNYRDFRSISGNDTVKIINQKVSDQKGNGAFTMHCCPLCRKLMSLQSHRPFLIIPCGHNICAQCQPAQTECPTCNTQVSSTVENATLSHVIREYKKQEEREELARKEEEARKFVEEYDSLKTRYDVLSCKAENVLETMESITANLVQSKRSMKTIEEKKAEIRHKISCLKEELSNCEMEFADHEKICNELEVSYSKEKDNLELIENTLDRVKQSKERVKQLILSYIPSFRFEDD